MSISSLSSCSCSDLIPFWANCCSSAPIREHWEQVNTYRQDSQGKLYLNERGSPKVYTYLQDKRTGTLYCNDSEAVVATKCTAIFIGMPFYATGAALYHTALLPVDVVRTAISAVQQFHHNYNEKGFGYAFCILIKTLFVDLIFKCLYHLWGIARSFLFGSAIMVLCLYALVNPYDARIAIGTLEWIWHDQIPHTESYCHVTRKMDGKEAITEIFKAKVLYLAFCFQPIRDTNRVIIV